MDGAFGLGGLADEIDPTSGALAGLLKTARQEWPEVHCKAVDLDAAYKTLESAAERIVEEMLRRGPAEVGLTESATNQVELVALPAARAGSSPRSSASRRRGGRHQRRRAGYHGRGRRWGLPRRSGPGLSCWVARREPEAEPAWLAPLETDAAIRRAIRDHADRPCSPQVLSETAPAGPVPARDQAQSRADRGCRRRRHLSRHRRAESGCREGLAGRGPQAVGAGPGLDPRRRRTCRPADRGPDRCPVRSRLRHEGRGAAIALRRDRSASSFGSSPSSRRPPPATAGSARRPMRRPTNG